MNIEQYIHTLAQEAKLASHTMALASTEQKNTMLHHVATLLRANSKQLQQANLQDIQHARANNLAMPLLERLTLNSHTIEQMAQGIEQIAKLPDPVGEMGDFHYQPSGIQVGKMRVPLGVIGIIYESRPNVTADAGALCLKAGNACILRGGSEAFHSNLFIAQLFIQALQAANLPATALRFVEHTHRDAVSALLRQDKWIDVIIPRGGKSLIQKVSKEAKIPVIKHLDGICHVYIDKFADQDTALQIAINAKTSRYSTCNTMETLLIHQSIAPNILPKLQQAFSQKQVELRGCTQTRTLLPDIIPATEEDWYTEYLAPILSIKLVDNLQAAIDHINHYGSHHTDSIVTEHYQHAQQFIRAVDSASVMINASTRFADGFEYGLGAEIGISTDKIHTRGPVGLMGLTNEKWVVFGHGEIR